MEMDRVRDSGICVDTGDDDSSTDREQYVFGANPVKKTKDNSAYVKKLAKQFEFLTAERQHSNFKCNWWLDGETEAAKEAIENDVYDSDNTSYHRKFSKRRSAHHEGRRSRSESALAPLPVLKPPLPPRPTIKPKILVQSASTEQSEDVFDSPNYDRQSSQQSNDSDRTKVPEIREDSVSSDIEADPDDFETEGEAESNIEYEVEGESDDMVNWVMSRELTSTSRPTSTHSNKLLNIVRELLENEENYVRTLQTGIKNYYAKMDSDNLPKSLMGQKFRIFGNIENIHRFHRDDFLPKLLECNEDIEAISDTFTYFIQNDYFYGYVLYAINSKKSEALCNSNVSFFSQIQENCGDKLGINSFLLQPIQRLPRYQLLLQEIIKELYSELPNSHSDSMAKCKTDIAACCVAEKNIQRLVITVNQSMSINDIQDCYENEKSIGLGLGLVNSTFFVGPESFEPKMFLVPKYSPVHGYQAPINIFCQGKFKKMSEFDIQDWDLRRKYRGKVFLFEKCTIYTEIIDRENLEYRGHYMHNKFGLVWRESKPKFKLFEGRRGNRETEFAGDLVTVQEWANIIQNILMAYVAEEKEKLRTLVYLSRSQSMRHPDSIRSSMTSIRSDQSNFSIRSDGSNSYRDNPVDNRNSQWYI